jgi:hypothetical protein
MKNTNLVVLIGTIIALTAAVVLLAKGCKKEVYVEKTFTQKQMDSVMQNYEKSTAIIDELLSRNNKTTAEKDSLLSVVDETGRKLEIQTLKTTALTRESQLARTKLKDMESAGQEFIDYVRSVDSLYPHIDSLAVLADSYRAENRSLQSSYDSLLSNNSLRISRLEFDRDFNKEKFDTLAVYTLALEKSKEKSDKKANKKWVLSIGGGGVIGRDGKPSPGAAIIIGRKIAQF